MYVFRDRAAQNRRRVSIRMNRTEEASNGQCFVVRHGKELRRKDDHGWNTTGQGMMMRCA